MPNHMFPRHIFNEKNHWYDMTQPDSQRWTGAAPPRFSPDTTTDRLESREQAPMKDWPAITLTHLQTGQHNS